MNALTRLALVLLGIAVGSAAHAAGSIEKLKAFVAQTQSARAIFTQQVMDKDGKTIQSGSGRVAFQRPGKFRWTYDKPNKQVLVGDGSKLWIHDPDLNQVTVKRIDRAISSTPAALLAGKDDITALFTLRDAGAADGLNWVEATPKAQDTGFDKVRLGLQGRTLAAMELFDSLGGHTLLRFSDLKSNAPVSADSFRFSPPKGADVLEDAPAKR